MPAFSSLRLAASPVVYLRSLAFINFLGFAGWGALLHNFTIEQAHFGWFETGLTQTVREIPGFLAFTAVFWLAVVREQVLAYAALLVLGLGVALTGLVPSLTGVLLTTFIMSVGFHYFETMNQSLQLQLLPKAEAPRLIGTITAAGAAAQFLAYGGLALAWWAGWRSYQSLFLVVGLASMALTVAAMAYFGRFEGTVRQRKSIVLRRRYWLYYLLTFMTGARRQLFLTFGGFLLVKKFGYSVADMATPDAHHHRRQHGAGAAARAARDGDRRAPHHHDRERRADRGVRGLRDHCERVGGGGAVRPGRGLLHPDAGAAHLLPEDRRPGRPGATTSVSFTINHIAAVAVPIAFGALGAINPADHLLARYRHRQRVARLLVPGAAPSCAGRTRRCWRPRRGRSRRNERRRMVSGEWSANHSRLAIRHSPILVPGNAVRLYHGGQQPSTTG